MPRIYQQVDWSNGGDGIVVRENIKTVADLRGKKLVLAQNSPSHYFALNTLVSGGVQPAEVDLVFTDDAFQAAAAFNAQKDIAGCVSWAPDIYNLEDQRQPLVGHDPGRQPADRRRVVRPRRLCPRQLPSSKRLTRGIFDAMNGSSRSQRKRRSPSSWPRATPFRRPTRWACWATPTAPTGPRTSSSS